MAAGSRYSAAGQEPSINDSLEPPFEQQLHFETGQTAYACNSARERAFVSSCQFRRAPALRRLTQVSLPHRSARALIQARRDRSPRYEDPQREPLARSLAIRRASGSRHTTMSSSGSSAQRYLACSESNTSCQNPSRSNS